MQIFGHSMGYLQFHAFYFSHSLHFLIAVSNLSLKILDQERCSPHFFHFSCGFCPRPSQICMIMACSFEQHVFHLPKISKCEAVRSSKGVFNARIGAFFVASVMNKFCTLLSLTMTSLSTNTKDIYMVMYLTIIL